MPPNEPVWAIEPHTQAKHQILKKYLGAWLPILSSTHGRVLYVDGFAGPGIYAGGEPGSPIIALDEALNHRSSIQAQLSFLFIEDRSDRAASLQSLLINKSLPSNFNCQVHNASFAEVITGILYSVEERRQVLPPTFAFVDPFGYSQTPFALIQRLLSHPRCEVLITFMYQFINRFVSDPSQSGHLDQLYGTAEWRAVFQAHTPEARLSVLHGVYKRQLEQQAGTKYVLPFEMEDPSGQTEYFLFFCTNDLTGLKKMKHAMWAVDPTGGFRFAYSANPNQLRLFELGPDFQQLRVEITEAFRGQTVNVAEIEEFVLVKTPFLDTHYKRQVLVPMEREGRIEVPHSPRKRPLAYPSGTVITFLP